MFLSARCGWDERELTNKIQTTHEHRWEERGGGVVTKDAVLARHLFRGFTQNRPLNGEALLLPRNR